MATKRIALFICTTRQPRCNPQIAHFVRQAIESLHRPGGGAEPAAYSLHTVDVAAWQLPFCDEPDLPVNITHADQYVHAHTRRWSAEVSTYHGFVFVTPQYNWGYPAALKNAIDYLLHEWRGKAAAVVSYGGRGGGRANAQLRQVLQGVGVATTTTAQATLAVELKFPDSDFTARAAAGKPLGLDGTGLGQIWSEERLQIGQVFGDLLALIEEAS